ncbi:MAG: hypothetical protein ACK5V3_06475 [Bdellovibrionales bacterium]
MFKSLSLVLLLFSLTTLASTQSWQMGLGHGSYLGRSQIVGSWLSAEKQHELSLSLGFTQDKGVGPIWQYSAYYLFSLFDVRPINDSDVVWNPYLLGAFVTYTDNTFFYVDTEDPYPQDRYYDITSIRWGVRMSTQLQNIKMFERNFQISLDGSLLERALNNYFNNPEELDIFKYYWSLGISIKTQID